MPHITKKINIIGLNGTLQSGKDTTADCLRVLALNRDMDVKHISFANPLKDGMIPVFGGEKRNYYGTNADKDEEMSFWRERLGENFKSYRSAIQWIGTELFRERVHPDFWVFATERRILDILAEYPPQSAKRILFVAADVRFNNEANFVLKSGGRVAHILRADGVAVKTGGIENHKSEAGIAPDLITDTYTCEIGDHNKVALDLLGKIGLA